MLIKLEYVSSMQLTMTIRSRLTPTKFSYPYRHSLTNEHSRTTVSRQRGRGGMGDRFIVFLFISEQNRNLFCSSKKMFSEKNQRLPTIRIHNRTYEEPDFFEKQIGQKNLFWRSPFLILLYGSPLSRVTHVWCPSPHLTR